MATEVIQQNASNDNEDREAPEAKKQFAEGNNEAAKQNKNDKKKDHHHRRKPSKKKRKWKPYTKMTWEEKKAVEERETIRADRIRGEMMSRGRPVAPYNTTQFLMAEHDPYEEEECAHNTGKDNDSSNERTLNEEYMDESIEAEYTDSPHMAPEFISQDFSEAYERVQEESLSIMTRDDLVKEHLSLERTLTYLQGKLAEEKNINNTFSIKVQNVEEELEKLRKENDRLMNENMRLRCGGSAVNDADGSAVYQTSDYEYEIPTSDGEGAKYSEDYNNDHEENGLSPAVGAVSSSGERAVEFDFGCVSHSTETIDSLRNEASYEADGASSEDSDTIGKRKKRRKNREIARRHASDDASSSNGATDDTSTQNVQLAAGSNDRCDSDGKTDVAAEKTSQTEKHSQTSVASDVIMRSEKSGETMEADSYPLENRIPSSVSMQSLSPES